jgi:hypothetical protein
LDVERLFSHIRDALPGRGQEGIGSGATRAASTLDHRRFLKSHPDQSLTAHCDVFIPVARGFDRPIIAAMNLGRGIDLGSGEAAIALLESLMAFLERKGALTSEEIVQIYDGALQRIQSGPNAAAPATATELLRGGLRRRATSAN